MRSIRNLAITKGHDEPLPPYPKRKGVPILYEVVRAPSPLQSIHTGGIRCIVK
jgi:hypothetical protein